jgi:hypothetical protein
MALTPNNYFMYYKPDILSAKLNYKNLIEDEIPDKNLSSEFIGGGIGALLKSPPSSRDDGNIQINAVAW